MGEDANKKYIVSLIEKNLRVDGRALDKYRDIVIEYGVSSKSAEGSARVTIGDTIVVAGVKFEVGEPFPDKPDEGTIVVNAELLPLSSPEFESGPPDVQSIELARVVDRGIRESKAIDFKKLCIKEGEKVWLIFIDIYPINDAGNLFDAAALAAFAAVKDARFPKYDEQLDKVVYDERTDKKLPLENLPVACTVIKINGKLLVDPTTEEEQAMDARLTVATLENGNICAMQKGGHKPLSHSDIMKMVELASEKAKELRKLL
ncbi:MAG: exosome complex protein Rrp42 [Candidatus Nanoarchaeia archaeon]